MKIYMILSAYSGKVRTSKETAHKMRGKNGQNYIFVEELMPRRKREVKSCHKNHTINKRKNEMNNQYLEEK